MSIRSLTLLFCLTYSLGAADQPVSFYNDLVPIFKRSCNGCHHPGKLKGDLDMTTHATLLKGGKNGAPIKQGEPKSSLLIEEISGEEPSMPKQGDPLSKSEIALIERWISEGAKDDTPPEKLNSYKLAAPPAYQKPAIISALAFSPDGSLVAVSGYHEVLLWKSDGSELVGRLLGESPRIESIAFSKDGKHLAVAGGAPAVFGELQVWSVETKKLLASHRLATDSLYGASFSPDGQRIAFGSADKSLRMINRDDGKILLKFDNHSDWIFSTTFTHDGKRLLSGSRDRAMKLIDASNGQFIDDINKLLDTVQCFAHHPKEDKVVYGGEVGIPRLYRMSDNQGRTAANNDVNLLKQFERQPGAIHALAFSPDGTLIAIGGVASEVRIYKVEGDRVATLAGHAGAIFSIQFHPSRPEIATAGLDGSIRIYSVPEGKLLEEFNPFPKSSQDKVAAN